MTEGDVVAVARVFDWDALSEGISDVVPWVCVDCSVLDDSCAVGCLSEEDIVFRDASVVG